MKPRLLDLFSGAGGCSVGYYRAGFDVVGVDHKPMPRYPFEFHQADAFEFLAKHGREYDVIHASPPCQAYSVATKRWKGRQETHPDLIESTRQLLIATGKTWVIENVIGSPLRLSTMLCGTMFGLKVFRHRLFESSSLILAPSHPRHNGSTGSHRGYSASGSGRNGFVCVAGHNFSMECGAKAMGIDWMFSRRELCQAIPPAYTMYIGKQLLERLAATRDDGAFSSKSGSTSSLRSEPTFRP